jgi:hypothetical protein
MLTKSMFTPNRLCTQKSQKYLLLDFYQNSYSYFGVLVALWESSKKWKENKLSIFFGKDLSNFQSELLKNPDCISNIKSQILSSQEKHSLLSLEPEYQKAAIITLIEMCIFHEAVKEKVSERFVTNYAERKNLFAFMQSDIFTELCDYSNLTKVLQGTFSEEYENAYMKRALEELDQADLLNFEEASKKYKDALLHIQDSVTEEDEQSILHSKKEKLAMFLKKDFSKYEGDITKVIDCIICHMTQDQTIRFFLTLEKKNVPMLVSLCKSILESERKSSFIYSDYEKLKVLANICKSFILTSISLRRKEVLQDEFFQASDFAGMKIAYKNIGDQISKTDI